MSTKIKRRICCNKDWYFINQIDQ